MQFEYVIVGGGMTADAAVRGIRSVDSSGSIAILGEEPDPPYDRPPLSKSLWNGADEEGIWRDTESLDVDLLLGRRVVRLDREARTVTDEGGQKYVYSKLLLATGGSPRRLDDAVPQVNYFRTFQDYRRLRKDAERKRRFAVVGGGFIGSEMAASLAASGKKVTLLFPEEGPCRRILPPSLAGYLQEYYEDRGVEVRSGETVASVRRSGDEFLLAVRDGSGPALRVDGVVAGLGIEPEVGLAAHAGLEVEDGIVVDEHLRTADPRIFAAGDAAACWSRVLGRRIRVEHEENANSSGMQAGRAMAGEAASYDPLPYLYSDLFDIGFEAVGVLDPDRMAIVEDWTVPNELGVVYYLEGDRIRGVLLWNIRGRVREARSLIREGRAWELADLEGRIEP